MSILGGHRLGGIHHQNGHMGPTNRPHGPHDAIFFDPDVDVPTLTNARRIDQNDALPSKSISVSVVSRVVPGMRRDERPVFLQNGIEQAGFTHVRPSDQGNPRRTVRRGLFRFG